MNTLFAVLVMAQDEHAASAAAATAVPAGAGSLSPEKHLRIQLSSPTEPYNEAATTPEAFTDSDNDSAFESENEPTGGKRGLVSILGTPKTAPKSRRLDGPCRWRCNQGGPSQHLGQPLPRKVRFKIDRGQQQYRRQDGVEERRATTTVATAVQGNALLALGTMNSAQQRALLGVQQAQKKQQERARARVTKTKRSVAAIISPGSAGNGIGAMRWTGVAWKKRGVSPFKAASVNNNARRWPCPSAAAAANNQIRRQSSTSSATTTIPAATTTIDTTPASPKKRNVPSVATMLRLRARGNSVSNGRSCSSAVGGKKSNNHHHRRPSRSSVATTVVGAPLAAPVPGSAPMETCSSREASRIAVSASPPALSAPLDLSCQETFDIDAVMRPGGEVRTPICRFLLPCWPEGVEGYEEAGGWRRLGGPTRETFPRGRRCS